jgi:murein DD-endopeptidase MepM/ murein hydrolase activator NlpD
MKFHPLSANEQVAFIGLPLNSEPGITRMVITGYFPDMTGFSLDQPLLIGRSGYAEDPPLMVDPITIDPTTIEQEDALIFEITSKVTSDRLWNEKFSYPIDDPCIRAQFGNRRVYNFAYDSFHTGVDFGVCAQNLNIYAASPGVVVFTGPLVIRGNATIIDHGWGVYSGYWHQSGINVALGDRVDAGQIIGTIGTTGRSTGPHLHWEIRINGIPINPIDWIEKSSP